MSRVLVTGATGLIGRALSEKLASDGHRVRAALRVAGQMPPCVAEQVIVGALDAGTDWSAALDGVDAVVHLAARTHVLSDTAAQAELYSLTNAYATRSLVAAAARARVRRFVYVSSIKVNGEGSARPYATSDAPKPVDAYGKSKMLAESLLRADASEMEFAIVRPPLVYGPGVRANFLRLMQWIDGERPLPFGLVNNQRSLVNVWNVADLIARLVTHPRAPGEVWLVSDGEELSTRELVCRLAAALGRRPRLLPVPPIVLRCLGALAGRREDMRRLCDSLTVDISRTQELLEWVPPVSLDEGLARTVVWYRSGAR
jgi:nucleoside-diphosphate-sugar epimerase